MNDKPTFSTFDPTVIAWQDDVIDYLECAVDWGSGTQEILLSGAVGSAKTTLLAHLIVKHCLQNNRACVLIGRKALPDLKNTLYSKIIEHLDQPNLKEGRDYIPSDTTGYILFPKTQSRIIAGSWADKRFKKFRSLELSMAVFEELTENDSEYAEAYHEISMRVGRLNHIKEKLIISATNPDSPSHWAYKHFITSKSKNRKVFYSKTEDNPFLPSSYIEKLKEDLDEKMIRRMLFGEWVEIADEIIYYQYKRERNFKETSYEINPLVPIHICWDFNIALGKPMSACVFQVINKVVHVFKEIIIHGSDTEDVCNELTSNGLLDHETRYLIHGDATGRSGSSKSKYSDYDIISKFLSNYRTKSGAKLDFDLEVPLSNPPIRERHNIVNAYCCNSESKVRLLIYKDCPVLDEGLRLTALKKGGSFIEDDSKSYQHVTTALGYGIWWINRELKSGPSMASHRIR